MNTESKFEELEDITIQPPHNSCAGCFFYRNDDCEYNDSCIDYSAWSKNDDIKHLIDKSNKPLYPCPYDNSCQCDMDDPCRGCETFEKNIQYNL